MALRLRLRGPAGKQVVASLPEEATLADLVREASASFSISEQNVELLLGFPPSLCSATPQTALTTLVRNGDSATVREGTGRPSTQAFSSEAFAPVGESAAPALASNSLPARPSADTITPPTQVRGRGIASVRASEPWDCPACTLQNPGSAQLCQACEGPRPGSHSAPTSSGGGSGGGGGGGGGAQLVPMPDDNSCLFHGIAYLLDSSRPPNSLRQIVASEVQANPSQWDEATLGKPRQEYVDFITNPIRWGGQVELAILSSAYKAEIGVVEVQSGRCDIYGEGSGYRRRVYLIHSGIHFDAISFGPTQQREVSPDGFPEADAAVRQLAVERRRSGAFVDQDKMRLRCKICGFIAEGDYEARAHAGGTGHKEFAPA